MCLFTILMLNVCGVTIVYGNTTDKQDFQDKMEIISPWLYFICLSCEEFTDMKLCNNRFMLIFFC